MTRWSLDSSLVWLRSKDGAAGNDKLNSKEGVRASEEAVMGLIGPKVGSHALVYTRGIVDVVTITVVWLIELDADELIVCDSVWMEDNRVVITSDGVRAPSDEGNSGVEEWAWSRCDEDTNELDDVDGESNEGDKSDEDCTNEDSSGRTRSEIEPAVDETTLKRGSDQTGVVGSWSTDRNDDKEEDEPRIDLDGELNANELFVTDDDNVIDGDADESNEAVRDWEAGDCGEMLVTGQDAQEEGEEEASENKEGV